MIQNNKVIQINYNLNESSPVKLRKSVCSCQHRIPRTPCWKKETREANSCSKALKDQIQQGREHTITLSFSSD